MVFIDNKYKSILTMKSIIRKRKWNVLVLLLFWGILPLYLHAQRSYASNDLRALQKPLPTKADRSDMMDLKNILPQLATQYHLHFVYDDAAIQGVQVPRSVLREPADRVISSLARLLKNKGLELSIFGDRQYGITKESIAFAASKTQAELPGQIHLTGTVKDKVGNPLIGVTVRVKGKNVGTVTDNNGGFVLDADPADTLEISFVGYLTQSMVVGNRTNIPITLLINKSTLNEVVVVGYGTQTKKDITGSISSINGKQLTTAPVASTANALAGRLPGLISLQSSGQPGFDAASLNIRGFGSPLVIVDGVESNFNLLDPDEIESVSILKDGAASIYGARAGNGVILVTTKRGVTGKPEVTLNASYSLQGVTATPKPANAGEYAEWEREAWLNSGKPEATAPFTAEQVQEYFKGSNPLFPNTDWYNVLFRNWAPEQQYNLSVRGGSDRIKYYGFVGYLDQQTMVKLNGGDYKRYNIQSNIDAKILDNLSLQLNFSSVYETRNFPWRGYVAGANTVWQDFWNTLPIYPASLPDPTKISFANGGGTGGAHVVTNSAISGYDNTISQNLQGTIRLNYSFNSIKGLSAKLFTNVLQDYDNGKEFQRPVQFYTYDPQSKIYTLAGALGSNASLSQSANNDRTLTGDFSLNYDNVFGQNHHLSAMVLYEAIDYNTNSLSAARINFLSPAVDQMFAGSTAGMTNNGSATEMGRKSYVGRVNYSYKDKYLAELIFRADASAKFPSEKRWGYFPSVSLGWRLSDEPFLKNATFLDNLMIKTSYGESGLDNVGNFQYLTGYAFGLTYILNNNIEQGIASTGLANPDLTWEKVKIYNIGIDYSLFNQRLYGTGDFFYRILSGIPATLITSLPASFGANLPPENINSQDNRGFEFTIGTRGATREFSWDASGNISWSRAKWIHYEEPSYTDPDQKRIFQKSGRWTDETFGYVAERLFTSQKEIDNLPFDQDGAKNSTLRPGDIRYADVTGGDTLNWRDQVEIGKGTVPHWMFGFNINLKYGAFDLSTLMQGAFGFFDNLQLVHGQLPPAIAYNLRWTESNNNPHALIPRLGGAATNGLFSTYDYKSASYLRMKTFSLGYNLPDQVLKNIKLEGVRFYIAGYNLLTFSGLNKYQVDPEAPSGNAGYYYPQQRTISFGVNVKF